MTHNKINYLEIFRQHGLRVTKQRQAILDAICMADGHATVAQIYRQAKALDESIDRSTIYRTLDVFVELGIVVAAEDLKRERVYELVKENPHHHLICKQCGHDLDIENQLVDEFYRSLKGRYNFKVSMDHLIVFGVCPQCSE